MANGVTNWEMNQILKNPKLLKNTTFFDETGKDVTKEWLAKLKKQ